MLSNLVVSHYYHIINEHATSKKLEGDQQNSTNYKIGTKNPILKIDGLKVNFKKINGLS